MNREEAKAAILARISCKDYLEKSKKGGYNCYFCGSGTHANETGAVKYYEDTNTWYCHSCKRGGDVIDLYRAKTGAGYNEALSLLANELNISITSYHPAGIAEPAASTAGRSEAQSRENADKREITPEHTKTGENGHREPESAPRDYTEYYRACRERLKTAPEAIAYLQSRGISLETAAAYWIGYDPAADPANAPGAGEAVQKPHPAPRIIIPTSKAHYIGRSIDPETPKAYSKMNAQGSKPDIFNKSALFEQEAQDVFILEGAFDALSVIEAGAPAIALNSAANGKLLLQSLEDQNTNATLILCKDNDPNPQTAERIGKEFEELKTGLQRLNVSVISADINGKYKDANEALTENRAAFIEAVQKARNQAAARPDNTAYYIETLMQEEIGRFQNVIKTGFTDLDSEEKAGGLYPGLYILAAISSLGKTSFALQLADQIAESGNEVIFFTLEQSRLELVTKSIARRMAQEDRKEGGDIKYTPSSLAIRRGFITDSLKPTIENYKAAIKDRMSIIEGNFSCNVSFIGEYIRQYIRRNNTRPVIFIDYLQILQPEEDAKRQSTKDAIDSAVTQLKRISRELNLTIFLISSVNRANYLTPIDFESLKESGGIEYTADVIYGLQLECLNEELFDKETKTKEKREKVREAKAETPRKIELLCLKNRYGKSSFSCYYDYYPANDLFIEREAESTKEFYKKAIRI